MSPAGIGQGQPAHRPPTKPHKPEGGIGQGRPAGHGGGGGGNHGGMGQAQQSAYDYFIAVLQSYGFTDIAGIAKVVRKAILDGVTDPAQLDLLVRDTPEWHARFAGNDLLTAAGGNALSVAEYLSVESSYRQIMSQAGLPQGFYDDPSDFAEFIGASKSPAEIQSRIALANDQMNRNGDAALKEQFLSMGIDPGHILARYLDPEKSLPLLQRDYQTALIGAAARRAGVTPDNSYAAHLNDIGVSEAQAIQGYGAVADITPKLDELGSIYGEDFTQSDAEREVFEGGSSDKRRRLSSQERGSFSGSSGAGQNITRGPSGSF